MPRTLESGPFGVWEDTARDARGAPTDAPSSARVGNASREPPRGPAALAMAIDVLELLAAEREPLRLTDLAKGVGKRPGNLYRIVAYLRDRGYVQRVGRSGGYVLTSRIVALAHGVRPADRLAAVGRDCLLRASEQLGRTCYFVALEGSRIVVVARERPRAPPVALDVAVGARVPALRTDVGRLLLAGCVGVWLQRRMRTWPEYQSLSQRERQTLAQDVLRLSRDGFVSDGRGWTPGLMETAVRIGSEHQGVMVALAMLRLEADPEPGAAQALAVLGREACIVADDIGLPPPSLPPPSLPPPSSPTPSLSAPSPGHPPGR